MINGIINAQEYYLVPVSQQPTELVLTTAGADKYIDEGDSVKLGTDIQVSGGSGSKTYQWVGSTMNDTSYTRFYYTAYTGVYGLTVTDEINCSVSDELEVFLNSSSGFVDIEDSENVKIYPNPASGIVNISFTDVAGVKAVRIFSSDGRMVLKESVSDEQSSMVLNVENLSNGDYLVVLEQESNVLVKPLIIN